MDVQQPTSPEQARTMLDTLRTERIENRVTDRDYIARADYLGRIAEGDQNVAPPPSPHATQEQRLAVAVDEAMEPPSNGGGYHFDSPPLDTPEALAFDTSVRQSMHEAGVPAVFASHMYSAVNALAERFRNASQDDITAHVGGVAAQLRQLWGDGFKAKVDAIDELVAGVGGDLGEALAARPWLLADQLVMTQLDAVVQHRARKRA